MRKKKHERKREGEKNKRENKKNMKEKKIKKELVTNDWQKRLSRKR